VRSLRASAKKAKRPGITEPSLGAFYALHHDPEGSV